MPTMVWRIDLVTFKPNAWTYMHNPPLLPLLYAHYPLLDEVNSSASQPTPVLDKLCTHCCIEKAGKIGGGCFQHTRGSWHIQ
jgi:hypothetical protein